MDKPVVVVSGLPRSGTSMMMQMLGAGGIDLLYDNTRPADDHNPAGYFELGKVKYLDKDNSWLFTHRGKAIKILFHLLHFLPDNMSFRIIFLLRPLDEIIRSQNKMLESYNKALDENEKVHQIFEHELGQIRLWLSKQKNIKVLFVKYDDVVEQTEKVCQQIEDFLNTKLNFKKMKDVVLPKGKAATQ